MMEADMAILKWPLDGYRRFLDWRELRALREGKRTEDIVVPKKEAQAWNERSDALKRKPPPG